MKRRALAFAALVFGLGIAGCNSAPKPKPCPGIRYLRRPPHVLPRQTPIQWAALEESAPGSRDASRVDRPDASPLVASGWCTLRSRTAGPGCDVGVGLALYTRSRVSWVAVVGSKTIGTGLGFTAYTPTPQFPHVLAVAVGVVARYDSTGIAREVYPALGATLSFGGKKGGGE